VGKAFRYQDLRYHQVTSDDVYYAKKFGYVIKLLGTAINKNDWLELSVEPCLIPVKHSFAHIHKEYNAVIVQGDASGDIMLSGKGAARCPRQAP